MFIHARGLCCRENTVCLFFSGIFLVEFTLLLRFLNAILTSSVNLLSLSILNAAWYISWKILNEAAEIEDLQRCVSLLPVVSIFPSFSLLVCNSLEMQLLFGDAWILLLFWCSVAIFHLWSSTQQGSRESSKSITTIALSWWFWVWQLVIILSGIISPLLVCRSSFKSCQGNF